MRLVRWFQRLIDCWGLARQVQRGLLVTVSPDYLAALTLAANTLRTLPLPEPAAPVAVQEIPAVAGAALADPVWPVIEPGAPFEVRVVRPGQKPRVIASGTAEYAKRVWRDRGVVPEGTLELYDVKLNLVRGIK